MNDQKPTDIVGLTRAALDSLVGDADQLRTQGLEEAAGIVEGLDTGANPEWDSALHYAAETIREVARKRRSD